nr:hypothetical protein [uncultured Pedobacter sp.]
MTNPTFIMATMCLNFSYTKLKEKSHQNELQLYQYGFSGFKSGNAPDLKIKKNCRGHTMIIINHTIEQLFAIAYGDGASISKEQIIIDVIEPKKLQEMRCYKLFVPQHQIDSFYIIMQQNLTMEFPDYIITVESIGNKNYIIIKDIDGYGK